MFTLGNIWKSLGSVIKANVLKETQKWMEPLNGEKSFWEQIISWTLRLLAINWQNKIRSYPQLEVNETSQHLENFLRRNKEHTNQAKTQNL